MLHLIREQEVMRFWRGGLIAGQEKGSQGKESQREGWRGAGWEDVQEIRS